MNIKRASIAAGALAASFALGYVVAQQAATQQAGSAQAADGIRRTPMVTVELGRHFDAMQGRQLVLTHFLVDAGAKSAVHNHKGRPEVIYMLKGDLLEHEGSERREMRAGQAVESNPKYAATAHYIENVSGRPAEAIGVSIVTPPQR